MDLAEVGKHMWDMSVLYTLCDSWGFDIWQVRNSFLPWLHMWSAHACAWLGAQATKWSWCITSRCMLGSCHLGPWPATTTLTAIMYVMHLKELTVCVCVIVCVCVVCGGWRHENSGDEQVGVKKSPQWPAIRDRNRTNGRLRTSFGVWIAQGVQLRGTLSISWRMAGRRRCEQTATKKTSRRGDAASSAIAEDSDYTTPVCQAASKPDLELARLRQAAEGRV